MFCFDLGGLGTVIVAGSLIISLAALSQDIVLKIGKCCVYYPDTCTYRDEFLNKWKPKLESKSKEVDFKYVASTSIHFLMA